MKTYETTTDFVVPPEFQGQMVEYAYALCVDDVGYVDAIIERRKDETGKVTYTAYEDWCPGSEDWGPQNGQPKLGRCLGECLVEGED